MPDRPPAEPNPDFAEDVELSTGLETGALATESTDSLSPPPPAGQPLPARIGRFEIRSLLGAGAFGQVFLGFDGELQREVAIKVPRANRLTPEYRERFLREARAAATVQHPNVCPVHEVGTDDGLPFIVMAYVPGPTLERALSTRGGFFPPRQAAAVVRKLALAVDAAHKRGVIHRDLKPGNVLVDRERGEVLITDFGLARVAVAGGSAEHLTREGTILGTPAYMAPEQAAGDVEAVGPASDVYSLGAIFYHLLTGRPPFAGTLTDMMMDLLGTAPQPPSSRRAEIDPLLDAICLKALAKKPADRQATARILADDLGAFLRALGSESHPGQPGLQTYLAVPIVELASTQAFAGLDEGSTAVPTPANPVPRFPWSLVGAALLVAVVAVGGVLYYATSRPSAATPEPTPPVVGKPAAKPTPKPAATDDDRQRAAVEWMLASGAEAYIRTASHESLRVLTKGELPAKFELVRCVFHHLPNLTDEDFEKYLGEIRTIEVIQFADCPKIGKKTIERVRQFPRLQIVDLTFLPALAEEDFRPLFAAPAMERLVVSGNRIGPESMRHLANAKRLQSLWIANNSYSDDSCAAIATLKDLHELTLSEIPANGITPDGVAHFAKLPILRQFSLSYSPVNDAHLTPLATFPKLEFLYLVGTAVTDEGAAKLAAIPALKELYLDVTAFGDRGVEGLASARGLKVLSLRQTRVTDAGLKALEGRAEIEGVFLEKTAVSDVGVRSLATLANLKSASFECPEPHLLTDASVSAFAKMAKLAELSLKATAITPAGATAIKKALPNCRVLHDGREVEAPE